jgi:hypothetical protein
MLLQKLVTFCLPVPGSLDIKGGKRCNLLLYKRWNLIPSFLSNKPGTGLDIDSVLGDKFSFAKMSALFMLTQMITEHGMLFQFGIVEYLLSEHDHSFPET